MTAKRKGAKRVPKESEQPLNLYSNSESYELMAIQNKCYECMLRQSERNVDCKRPECPLYRFMPYRGMKSRH